MAGGGATESRWLRVEDVGLSKTGKTRVWAVSAKDGDVLLGHVSWFGRWRTYAFFPSAGSGYDPTCLRDIAEFIKAAESLDGLGRDAVSTRKGR
mgnify:CR=1 FL=1